MYNEALFASARMNLMEDHAPNSAPNRTPSSSGSTKLPEINNCISTSLVNRASDNDIIDICNKIIDNISNNIGNNISQSDSKILTLHYILTRRNLFQNLRKYVRKVGYEQNIKIDVDGLITRWLFSQQILSGGEDQSYPYIQDIQFSSSITHELLKDFMQSKPKLNKDELLDKCTYITKDFVSYSNNLYNKRLVPLYKNNKVYSIKSEGSHDILHNNYPFINIVDSTSTKDAKILSWNNNNNKKTIMNVHYYKLKSLFTSYTLENKDEVYTEDKFHYLLFVLIDQYDNMLHDGYQASIPPGLANYLQIELGVSTEMFASPMNALYPNYYSAYPFTDKYFMSKGSILFNFMNIEEGSFESNPPYTEDFMLLNAYMITYILNKSYNDNDNKNKQKPLSFVIINPNWKDTPSFYALTNSKYNVLKNKYINIQKNKHKYISGNQHKQNNSYYVSGVGSFVYILQNMAGSRKWPATGSVVQNIVNKFC